MNPSAFYLNRKNIGASLLPSNALTGDGQPTCVATLDNPPTAPLRLALIGKTYEPVDTRKTRCVDTLAILDTKYTQDTTKPKCVAILLPVSLFQHDHSCEVDKFFSGVERLGSCVKTLPRGRIPMLKVVDYGHLAANSQGPLVVHHSLDEARELAKKPCCLCRDVNSPYPIYQTISLGPLHVSAIDALCNATNKDCLAHYVLKHIHQSVLRDLCMQLSRDFIKTCRIRETLDHAYTGCARCKDEGGDEEFVDFLKTLVTNTRAEWTRSFECVWVTDVKIVHKIDASYARGELQPDDLCFTIHVKQRKHGMVATRLHFVLTMHGIRAVCYP